MTAELAALSAVICDIYDAAVDASLWPRAMQSCCGFIGGFECFMFWRDAVVPEANALHVHNHDPCFAQLYREKYAPLDPVFPAAVFLEVGRVCAVTDLIPKQELVQTRFYKEWITPQGITDTLSVSLEREELRAAFFVVQWHGGLAGEEARRRMALLVPHLQRGVAIGRLFFQQKSTQMALAETLDHVDAGVFLVAANGQIVFANTVGRAMTEEGGLLRVKSNSLVAVAEAADGALKDGLRSIKKGDSKIGARGLTIALSNAPDHRWMANVLPLVDGARRRTGEAYEAIAAVFVRNSVFSISTPLETLAKRYGLTASELRVTDAILRVSGVEALAETLGVSRATVKTHLNHIFRKCDVRNQSDLIKLVAGVSQKS